MGKIILLDENTSNQIAAGEVVERPASVIKELVENSIDAGADNITVEIKNGGIKYIKVTDNGSGIDDDDIEIAFERHSTSKIRGSKDLDNIVTLGFRGEALASIASVSKVTLITKTNNMSTAKKAMIIAGEVKEMSGFGAKDGTSFIIEDLFFNTPARFKFLKSDISEAKYISDMMIRLALGNPKITMKLINNGKTVMHTPGNGELNSTIYSLYGSEIANDIIKVTHESEKISIKGFIGREQIARASRSYQSVFVNGRYVKNGTVAAALDEAYKTYLMKSKYPFAVINIEINPKLIDVNVHPAKTEIKFSDEKSIFREIFISVTNALNSKRSFKSESFDNDKVAKVISYKPVEQKTEVNEPVKEYIKQKTFEIIGELNKIEENTKKESYIVTNSQIEITDIFAESQTTEALQSKENKELIDAKYIGQAFNTYIILQNNDELIYIDQHAAHERILFEKFLVRYKSKEIISQTIIKPMIFELNANEYEIYSEHKDIIKVIGFEVEDFGELSVMLRAIPVEFDSISKNDFIDILLKINESDSKDIDAIIYMSACKAAIKANKKLSEIEITELIKELSKCENPYHCPHGRPVAFKLSKNELEKKFKRRL